MISLATQLLSKHLQRSKYHKHLLLKPQHRKLYRRDVIHSMATMMHPLIREDKSSQQITNPTLQANREMTLKRGHQFKAAINNRINQKKLLCKTLHQELISYQMGLGRKAKLTKRYYQALEDKAMTTKNRMLMIEVLSQLRSLKLNKDQHPSTCSIPQQILTGWVVFPQPHKSVTKCQSVEAAPPRLPCQLTPRSLM